MSKNFCSSMYFVGELRQSWIKTPFCLQGISLGLPVQKSGLKYYRMMLIDHMQEFFKIHNGIILAEQIDA